MFEVEGATRAEPPAREAWWKWRGVFSCSTVLTGKGCLYSSVIVLGALIEHFSLHLFRKQCIELEQQFDFLKDLVASVPDMQGDGEDNHMDGEKGPRRWVAKTRHIDGLYLPEGAGNQAAAAGRMEAQEAKAKTRSCLEQTQNRR